MGNWKLLTCYHGIQEGLDSHPCNDCYKDAVKLGYDMSNNNTYIFRKNPHKKISPSKN